MGLVCLVVGVLDGEGDAAAVGELVSVGAGPFADFVEFLFGALRSSGRLWLPDLSGGFDERLEVGFQFFCVCCGQIDFVGSSIDGEGDCAPVVGAGDEGAVEVVVDVLDEFSRHVVSL